MMLAIVLFDDISLWFFGMGIVVLGVVSLYKINH